MPAFGLGSSRSRDYVATGTPTAGRGKRMDEGLAILSRLWSEESVSFRALSITLRKLPLPPDPYRIRCPYGSVAPPESRRTHSALGNGVWEAGIESADQVAPVIKANKGKKPSVSDARSMRIILALVLAFGSVQATTQSSHATTRF
ncbi:MAG: hypothetical protein Ct9H300mP8_00620 [Gammaproteobacteria bacterium]|nr:MAG: hypothetical protein Ct9H300mP8_00620 [Gammaproteobacteria bacterium]